MTTTDPAKPAGPGRGRRAVVADPHPAAAERPLIVDNNPPPDASARVFVERSDEAVLILVHAFNQTGYTPVVTFGADGTKTIAV